MYKTYKKCSPLHLTKAFKAGARRDKKMLAKSEWLKGTDSEVMLKNKDQVSKGGGHQRGKAIGRGGAHRCDGAVRKGKSPSTVLFIPWTAHGILAGRFKAEEDRLAALTGFRIKSGEEPLWRQFSTSLGDGLACDREDCVTCSEDDPTKVDCFKRSIVYEAS